MVTQQDLDVVEQALKRLQPVRSDDLARELGLGGYSARARLTLLMRAGRARREGALWHTGSAATTATPPKRGRGGAAKTERETQKPARGVSPNALARLEALGDVIGRVSDREIERQYGIARRVVRAYRRSRGIPTAPRNGAVAAERAPNPRAEAARRRRARRADGNEGTASAPTPSGASASIPAATEARAPEIVAESPASVPVERARTAPVVETSRSGAVAERARTGFVDVWEVVLTDRVEHVVASDVDSALRAARAQFGDDEIRAIALRVSVRL